MAEESGTIATAIDLTAEGITLSRAISDFINLIVETEDELKQIANDVRATAQILEKVKDILEEDRKPDAPLYRKKEPEWYDNTTEKIAKCAKILERIQEVLDTIDKDRVREKERIQWGASQRQNVTILQEQLNVTKLQITSLMNFSQWYEDRKKENAIQRIAAL